MKLKCLIVDDEPLALDILENYIARLENVELVARCENAVEAFNYLKQKKVDILFLDIQMPKLTGIDFLKSINNPPHVIFTTAYREYALEGYELNALDYLLKPISFDRFLKAINKVYEINASQKQPTDLINSLNAMPISNYDESFMYLKEDKKMVRILLKDILYIESLKDYVRVKTKQKEVIAYQKISYLEEKLPVERFIRIHRSFIIALDKIEVFSSTEVEVAGKTIPIGRNYKSETLKLLNQHNLLEE